MGFARSYVACVGLKYALSYRSASYIKTFQVWDTSVMNLHYNHLFGSYCWRSKNYVLVCSYLRINNVGIIKRALLPDCNSSSPAKIKYIFQTICQIRIRSFIFRVYNWCHRWTYLYDPIHRDILKVGAIDESISIFSFIETSSKLAASSQGTSWHWLNKKIQIKKANR